MAAKLVHAGDDVMTRGARKRVFAFAERLELAAKAAIEPRQMGLGAGVGESAELRHRFLRTNEASGTIDGSSQNLVA